MRGFPCSVGIVGDLPEILAERIRTVWQPRPRRRHPPGEPAHRCPARDRGCPCPQGRGRQAHPSVGPSALGRRNETDLRFVGLQTSDSDYSPTTRCTDYRASPSLFHWESQNSASSDTRTGRRYVEQPDRGTNVILSVREHKKDGRGETLPYHCLGRARYCSHESKRDRNPVGA